MAKAVILSFSDRVDGTVIATIENQNGTVVITTEYDNLREQLTHGIMGRHGQVFKLSDGDNFIRELPYAFDGSRIRAKVI